MFKQFYQCVVCRKWSLNALRGTGLAIRPFCVIVYHKCIVFMDFICFLCMAYIGNFESG